MFSPTPGGYGRGGVKSAFEGAHTFGHFDLTLTTCIKSRLRILDKLLVVGVVGGREGGSLGEGVRGINRGAE